VLDILKIDKNCTDLQCFTFQFRDACSFGGAKPAKTPPVATGLNIVKCDLKLLFTRDT